MIEFKPVIESDKSDCEYKDINGFFGYIAIEDGKKEVGNCLSRLDGYSMCIISLSAQDSLTAQGLLRSALNFGANRGAYIAKVDEDSAASIAESMGFQYKDGVLTGEIPEILAGGCSGSKK